MLISVWDMLPDHPSCTFIGYITGLAPIRSQRKQKGSPLNSPRAASQIRRPLLDPEKLQWRSNFPGLSCLPPDDGHIAVLRRT
jgi:hypothetical protein